MSTMESHMMLMAEGFCFMQALRFVFAEISLPLQQRRRHGQLRQAAAFDYSATAYAKYLLTANNSCRFSPGTVMAGVEKGKEYC
jgi:hypothetical protein